MAVEGIGSNKESQIKYLRAQAEYDFAWVKYFDEICEVVARYDGKQATKRIDTALKKVNDNISFDVEKATAAGVISISDGMTMMVVSGAMIPTMNGLTCVPIATSIILSWRLSMMFIALMQTILSSR